MKFIKSVLVNGLILISVYLSVHYYQTRNLVFGAAPELSAVMLDGRYFPGLDSVQGPAIIHFWASWCKICEFEHESINHLSQEYSVVSVASQSGNDDEMRAYLKNNRIMYPVINDVSNQVTDAWGVSAYPTSFIVDENNMIRFVEVGLTTEMGLRIRLWLTKIW